MQAVYEYLAFGIKSALAYVVGAAAVLAGWLYLAITDATWTAGASIATALIVALSTWVVAARRSRSTEVAQLFKAGQELRKELRNEVVELRHRNDVLEEREIALESRVRELESDNRRLTSRVSELEALLDRRH